jgi:hypothetical protein
MKRREFVKTLGISSAAVVSVPAMADGPAQSGQDFQAEHDHGRGHDHNDRKQPPTSATVSFGEWKTEPPLDRYPNAAPAAANEHLLVPEEVTITVGGTVNFVISGLHQVIVYAPGKKVDEVQSALTRPTTGTPAGVLLINDTDRRLYAGPDPSLYPRDRVEVVQFLERGRHLVICGVQGHFLGGMFGYVRVKNDD